jgi:hypothetical protein
MIVPALVCEGNVWPSDEFWRCVRTATLMVEGQMSMVKPTTEEIEQMILRSWLEYSQPAGTA